MPTVTVSEENKERLERLRKDMPFVNNKVPSAKTTVELALEFVSEHKTEFADWLGKRSGHNR